MSFFVTIAETRTGIVIHAHHGTRHQEGDDDPRLSFEYERAAVEFSRQHVGTFPDRECLVTDEAGACLHVCRATASPCT